MFQIIFGILFPIVFGCWALHDLWVGQTAVVSATRSSRWPFVHGRVRSAQRAKRWSVGEPGMRPSIVYEYTVDGKLFVAERIAFGMLDYLFSGAGFAEKYIDRYPTGSRVQVFYDPAAPASAVLEPGLSAWTFMPTLIGAVLLLAAFLLLAAGAEGVFT